MPRRRFLRRKPRRPRHLRFEPLQARLPLAGDILVDSADDTLDANDGVTTLREAVQLANDTTGFERIHFDLPAGTQIILTQGELLIDDLVEIDGPGAGLLTISGNGQSRVLRAENAAFLAVLGLTLTGGNSSGMGGAIFATGTDVEIDRAAIVGNQAAQGGGFASDDPNSVVLISNSEFSDNSSLGEGGGLYLAPTAGITNSTVSGNTADLGGGIWTSSDITIEQTTISNNQSNSDVPGGGLRATGTGSSVMISASIVAGNLRNSSADDIFVAGNLQGGGSIVGVAPAVSGVDTFTGNLTNQLGTAGNPLDAMLAPLADNGGGTRTHSLRVGSPAIDWLTSGQTTEPLDQRGVPRPLDGDGDGVARADSGSLEIALLWHNYGYPEDVSNDGVLDPFDLNEILSFMVLNGTSYSLPPEGPFRDGLLVDVVPDDLLLPEDLLAVLSALILQDQGGEAEAEAAAEAEPPAARTAVGDTWWSGLFVDDEDDKPLW